VTPMTRTSARWRARRWVRSLRKTESHNDFVNYRRMMVILRLEEISMYRGALAPLSLLLFVAGCGSGDNLDRASNVVTTALTEWKNGGSPQKLVERGIDIAEPDWNSHYRLLDFKVDDASEQPQQGPRVVVVLNLQSPKGAKLTREVAYEVIMKSKQRV